MKLHGGCEIACQYCIRAAGMHTLQLENLLGTPKLLFAAPLYEKCFAYFGLACFLGGWGGGGWKRLPRWFAVFSPCSNGQFLVEWKGKKLFGQCPSRRATFYKGASLSMIKKQKQKYHWIIITWAMSMEYQTILFSLFNTLTGLMSSKTQQMCLIYHCKNWVKLGHNSNYYNYYQLNLKYFIFQWNKAMPL